MNNHKVGDILLHRATLKGRNHKCLGVISSIVQNKDKNNKNYRMYIVDWFDGMDGMAYSSESIAEFKADLDEYLGE